MTNIEVCSKSTLSESTSSHNARSSYLRGYSREGVNIWSGGGRNWQNGSSTDTVSSGDNGMYIGDVGVYPWDAGVCVNVGVYTGDTGMYWGDVGVYPWDVGLCWGDVGLYFGVVGLYFGWLGGITWRRRGSLVGDIRVKVDRVILRFSSASYFSMFFFM